MFIFKGGLLGQRQEHGGGDAAALVRPEGGGGARAQFGGGDDTVGNPHRAQISQFELVDLRFVNSSFSSLSSY